MLYSSPLLNYLLLGGVQCTLTAPPGAPRNSSVGSGVTALSCCSGGPQRPAAELGVGAANADSAVDTISVAKATSQQEPK